MRPKKNNSTTATKIEVINVSKRFKNEQVLKNINLTLTDDHIYGFVGRNGSGKSVLFKLICGYMIPDEGKIIVCGKHIGKDVDFPDSLGALIESPGFIWYQSGYANLLYLAKIRNQISKSQVKDAIRRVGLDPESRKWVGKYSFGMKQRLGIAQAIMEEPNILILDEPMNGLDESGVEDIRRLLLDYKKSGRIILITSHNSEDIRALCDEVYLMKGGTIEKKVDENKEA
ncbi:MAG TPA: ATP-binding cassette domain-containing protein [Candidatus Scybalocola faecavium]|nr:ATP-binding cassette domain-containing protein [Candidatus Scybalocola faecavium]